MLVIYVKIFFHVLINISRKNLSTCLLNSNFFNSRRPKCIGFELLSYKKPNQIIRKDKNYNF